FALPASRAEEKPAERKVAGRSISGEVSFLRREAPDKPWQPLPAKAEVMTGDLLIGAEIGASLDSANGAVRLGIRGDLDGNSPFSILETAISLNPATDVDLDVTLDRGRIDLVNLKEKGSARVRVHVLDRSGEVELLEPGARLAVEIYGRWPRGVPFV